VLPSSTNFLSKLQTIAKVCVVVRGVCLCCMI
jgi:hypothetical protein